MMFSNPLKVTTELLQPLVDKLLAEVKGHHPVHAGLQSHSVGGAYPLCVVGYGNGEHTTWVIENLTEGTVLCYRDPFHLDWDDPFQWGKYEYASQYMSNFCGSRFPDTAVWVKGRPKANEMGFLQM